MKFVKVIIFLAAFIMAAGFLPKAGSAADVSVGLSFGMPFPAVAVYPAVPHPPPVAVVPAPAAYYPAYQHYNRHEYGYKPCYRHHQGHGYWGRGYGNAWDRHNHDRR
ncbi:MAG: hypothetical protein ABFD50_13570 [Smithella sp.]